MSSTFPDGDHGLPVSRWRCATVLFALIISVWQTGKVCAAPPAGYYEVWGDDFNESSLNTAKWDYFILGTRRDAVDVTNAVWLTCSNLVITTYTSNSVNYSAMIATDGEFQSRYGYWEASIKWANSNGEWSAFWMQSPSMGTYLNDPIVSGSEIDIDEHLYVDSSNTKNIANQTQTNVHWDGYGSDAQSAGSGLVGSGLASGFHTYGFLWTSGSYSFSVDGNQVYNGGSAPVSHSPEFAILSSEVDDTSTTWAGYIPSGGYGNLGASPTKLTVDYVHYYAPTNTLFWTGAADGTYLTNSANYVSNMPPLSTSDLTFSLLSGSNLSPSSSGNLSVDGLIFTYMGNAVVIGGSNTLTLGAGGIDMVAANHSVTINCPVNIGLAQTWSVGPNSPGDTLTVNGDISGTATLSKGSYGTVVLNGTNSFSGTLNVDTGSTTANDGALQITRNANIAGVASPISIRNNNSGSSTLQLNGTLGSITIAQEISLAGRNTNAIAIENVAGSNTLSGNLLLEVGGGNYWLDSASGTLNFSGTVPASTPGGSRTLTFMGSGDILVSGVLTNGAGGGTVNVNVAGPGTLTLIHTNTYTGTTTISGGLLQVNSAAALGSPPSAFNSGQITFSGGNLEAQATLALNDGNRGLMLASNATLIVDSGATLTISNQISGAGNLTKTSPGTLVLNGSNLFTGTLNVDSGSSSANDGITHIASPNALANVASPISILDNNSGSSTFQLDGTAGGINLAQSFDINCRNSSTPTIENVTGTNQLSGSLWLNVGGSYFNFQSDAGLLILSGTNQYIGTSASARSYQFMGGGSCLVAGPILNSSNSAPISLIKNGSGALTLAAANTYGGGTTVSSGTLLDSGIIGSGSVTVSGGALGGNGLILGPVTIQSGGVLSPGAVVGLTSTLTISNTLTLSGGTAFMALNATAGANDQVRGLSSIALGGTLTVTNLSGILTAGQTFKLFSANSCSGLFANVNLPKLAAGLAWNTNALTSGVLSVVLGAVAPKFTRVSLAGTNLVLSGSGGAAGYNYSVLATTNLIMPLANWSLISTDYFDSSGNFIFSNGINPQSFQQFYEIQIN